VGTGTGLYIKHSRGGTRLVTKEELSRDLEVMGQELCNLRDELRDVQDEKDDLTDELTIARSGRSLAQSRLRNFKREADEDAQTANQDLSKQVCTYLDIIAEYENIVNQYVGHTGVKLVTTKINDLRKRGELSI
jgi:uncharacterized protein (DUF3084 family)